MTEDAQQAAGLRLEGELVRDAEGLVSLRYVLTDGAKIIKRGGATPWVCDKCGQQLRYEETRLNPDHGEQHWAIGCCTTISAFAQRYDPPA